MFSMPPATYVVPSPARIAWAASIAAFSPEPQTLLIVVAGTASGNPASSAACRAGACPTPAWTTFPKKTSSTLLGSISLLSNAARIATDPSCGAVNGASFPRKRPVGTRAAPTMTASGLLSIQNHLALRGRSGERGFGAARAVGAGDRATADDHVVVVAD